MFNSNTNVECIATNNPTSVNKHPAVIEYLGENYPLKKEYLFDYETDAGTIHETKEKH